MTIVQLEALMASTDMTKVISTLEMHLLVKNIWESLKEYDPKLHNVHQKDKRQDKVIKNESQAITKIIPVARLSLALQKKIVLMAATFLGTPCLESSPDGTKEDDLLTMVQQIWDANKLDYKFKKIAKTTLSERHCAELWFTQDVDQAYWEGYPINAKFKLSMILLANSTGDEMYPVFDEYGNMIAFGRGYRIREADESGHVNEVHHFDLYTDTKNYYSKKEGSGWVFASVSGAYSSDLTSIDNPFAKIPVIYYSVPATAWHDVQELIDRLETKLSNHADTNDYFDSPIVFVTGDVEGFADKGEEGKVLIGKNGGKAEYLVWNNAPESTKMEITNLLYFIHSLTHTPDISFDNMKGLGHFSGVALRLLFMDAHLKASDNEEVFGEGLQRRINWLKKGISMIDSSFKTALPLKICPKFNYFLPEDVEGTVRTLNSAVGGGILSQETAVRQNPLVSDYETELETIKTEDEAIQQKALNAAKAGKTDPGTPAPPGYPKQQTGN